MFYSNIIIARVIVVHLDYPKKIRKQLRLFPFTIHNFTTPNLLDVNNFSLHPVVQALQVLSNTVEGFLSTGCKYSDSRRCIQVHAEETHSSEDCSWYLSGQDFPDVGYSSTSEQSEWSHTLQNPEVDEQGGDDVRPICFHCQQQYAYFRNTIIKELVKRLDYPTGGHAIDSVSAVQLAKSVPQATLTSIMKFKILSVESDMDLIIRSSSSYNLVTSTSTNQDVLKIICREMALF